MNRRALLTLIGIAPVASLAPAQAMSGVRFAAGGYVRGESYVVGELLTSEYPKVLREALRVEVDEGEIARNVRAELARHGLFGHFDRPGFTDGDGI
jgi:hypothetical protein